MITKRVFVALLTIGIIAGLMVGVSASRSAAPMGLDQPSNIPVAWVPPPGSVQITGCFATQGDHWANPADLAASPWGPIYTVQNGRLISIEYAFAQSDFVQNKAASDLKFVYHGRELPIQHVDVDPLPPDIFGVPAFAMHFYLVTHAEDRAITCP
jgi:hypothetical protein